MSSEATKSVYEKLLEVQRALKVAKSHTNNYGGFAYRSKEDILEAAKPLCHEQGLVLICHDSVVAIESDWVYVKSDALVVDAKTGESVRACGYAREPESRKGMDASQITGTASSYAGKRALGNLFALDDSQDADAPTEPEPKTVPAGPFVAHCKSCGTRYQFPDAISYESFIASAGCCPSPAWEIE